MPTNHFFTLRNYVRMLVYGYAIGTLVVLVMMMGMGDRLPVVRTAVNIAIIGFCINSLIWALEFLVRNVSERLPMWKQFPMHVALTTAGGVAGFVIGRSVTTLVWHGRLPSMATFRVPIIVSLLVSFFAGVTMFFYIALEERLREKVREQELAQQELTLARAIQERLLPPPELVADGYRVTARNLAAQFVAGDFYDLIKRGDGSVIAVVADVLGKGVAASLIMASVKSVLPMIAAVESVPDTMRKLNEKLSRELGKREFVALACASFDPVTRRVILANAGLPDPYLIRNGTATPLVVTGPRFPLGIRANIEYESLSFELQPGDRLLLLTDGLPEASLSEDEPLGYERFATIAAASHASLETLFAAVESATKGARNDDWTAVMLEV
jgi:hypothetical protein